MTYARARAAADQVLARIAGDPRRVHGEVLRLCEEVEDLKERLAYAFAEVSQLRERVPGRELHGRPDEALLAGGDTAGRPRA